MTEGNAYVYQKFVLSSCLAERKKWVLLDPVVAILVFVG